MLMSKEKQVKEKLVCLPREDLVVSILEVSVLIFAHRVNQLVLMEVQNLL